MCLSGVNKGVVASKGLGIYKQAVFIDRGFGEGGKMAAERGEIAKLKKNLTNNAE